MAGGLNMKHNSMRGTNVTPDRQMSAIVIKGETDRERKRTEMGHLSGSDR